MKLKAAGAVLDCYVRGRQEITDIDIPVAAR